MVGTYLEQQIEGSTYSFIAQVRKELLGTGYLCSHISQFLWESLSICAMRPDELCPVKIPAQIVFILMFLNIRGKESLMLDFLCQTGFSHLQVVVWYKQGKSRRWWEVEQSKNGGSM